MAAALAASQAKTPDMPNDGDSDDVGGAAAQAVQAAPSPGTGTVVDKRA